MQRQRRSRRAVCRPLLLGTGLLAGVGIAAAQEPPRLSPIEIVAPTPVPGLGVPRDRLPANVQTLSSRELNETRGVNTAELLGLRLPSVNVNEFQGNPYQPDVNFRGYAASPLLGTPQGISVYQDGVRINDPFGDVVSWDLIPQAAIESIVLVPGSNPLFGLNTLGGALALRTKSGDIHRGTQAELTAGSFGRRVGQVETGQRLDGGWHAYAAGTWFEEDGWRDFSPSDVKQFFGKFGRRSQQADVSASVTAANTDLVGNGLAPESFLAQRRASIFTRPDNTRHRLQMLTLNGTYFLSGNAEFAATLYHRRLEARTLNGDVNDDFEDGPNDVAAGGTGLALGTAVNNRTATDQRGEGGALQWSALLGPHQLAGGVTHDRSTSDFEQTAQVGVFDATRGVIETDAVELENRLTGRTGTSSIFLSDTWSWRPDLHVTLSGRYNYTRVRLNDTGPSAPALDGNHRYSKFNPAAGVTYQANDRLTFYGGFLQGSRAPTPIELGCADPANPCTLPNALAADPPLNQVIARTFEFGVRGRLGGGMRWNAGLFQSTNTDDLLFVGTTTSAGFFTNFGKTRRRGAELGVSGSAGRFDWNAAYSFVRATFQSGACVVSENNSSRGTSAVCSPEDPGNPGTFVGDDLIAVQPGNRIPGIPEHSLKLLLNFDLDARWRIGTEVIGFSSQYVRGNENNAHEAGTFADRNGEARTFEGAGKVPGYVVVNLHMHYGFGGGWETFARISNLFDHEYATGGALAENPFDAAGTFITDSEEWARETFSAPGAPRAVWVGLRYRFGE